MEGRRVKWQEDMSQCRNQGCRDGYAALYTVKSGAKSTAFLMSERKTNGYCRIRGLGKDPAR